MKNKSDNKNPWWKNGVIYHIYPKSFNDSNNDGIGDLKGIINRLDYLSQLGIKAIWLSPIYVSPMIDSGYDISDYENIDPAFGTLDDFKLLIRESHQRGIRVIMDLVLNHTSDEHPWFQEAKSSINNRKRDWYIWHPKAGRKKPTNWRTNFGQSAWHLHKLTNSYYYHSFFRQQPDLNWHNPKVKEEFFRIIRYWLDLGVDGFRLDVINLLFKDKYLRNNSIFPFFSSKNVYNRNQPEIYEFLTEFRKLLDSYPEKTSIGEIYTPPPGTPALSASFLGNGNDMLHLAFDFSLFFTPWNSKPYYDKIVGYYNALPDRGWACFAFSNHDLGRSMNRFGIATYKYQKAKIQAVLLLTLKGTPFIYYGDEIGMENVSIPRKKIKDTYGKLFYPFYKGRDIARTPMQWNNENYAGFSTVEPWLPTDKNYETINVDTELSDLNSILNTYMQLIDIRNNHEELQKGEIKFLKKGENGIIAYTRFYKSNTVIIILNFSSFKKNFSDYRLIKAEVLYSTFRTKGEIIETQFLKLSPFEATVLELKQ